MRFLLALLLLACAVPAAAQDVMVTETRDAEGRFTLVHQIVVGAPVEEVWTAISTAEGWRTWAVPVAWDSPIEPATIETSYSPTATPGDPTTIRQHVIHAIPGHLLIFRTVKAPDDFPHFAVYREVTGSIELQSLDGARTHVRLTSAGYPDNEAGRMLMGFFRAGNRTTLEQLHHRFAVGPIDWSARRPRGH